MQPKEVLLNARKLIADAPEHLTDFYWKDSKTGKIGVAVGKDTPDCFCLAGAIHYTLYPKTSTPMNQYLEKYLGVLGFEDVHELFSFNDDHTKEDVLTLLDKAIAQL